MKVPAMKSKEHAQTQPLWIRSWTSYLP